MYEAFEYYRIDDYNIVKGRYLIVPRSIANTLIEDYFEAVLLNLDQISCYPPVIWRFLRRVEIEILPHHSSMKEQDDCEVCRKAGYFWGQRPQEVVLFESTWS